MRVEKPRKWSSSPITLREAADWKISSQEILSSFQLVASWDLEAVQKGAYIWIIDKQVTKEILRMLGFSFFPENRRVVPAKETRLTDSSRVYKRCSVLPYMHSQMISCHDANKDGKGGITWLKPYAVVSDRYIGNFEMSPPRLQDVMLCKVVMLSLARVVSKAASFRERGAGLPWEKKQFNCLSEPKVICSHWSLCRDRMHETVVDVCLNCRSEDCLPFLFWWWSGRSEDRRGPIDAFFATFVWRRNVGLDCLFSMYEARLALYNFLCLRASH